MAATVLISFQLDDKRLPQAAKKMNWHEKYNDLVARHRCPRVVHLEFRSRGPQKGIPARRPPAQKKKF
jgi:hypothetical protein